MPEIEVHTPPVPKGRPRIGKGRVFTPRATELAEHRIRQAWLDAGLSAFPRPVEVYVMVRLPRPKVHFGRHGNLLPSAPSWPGVRPDLDNYAKTVLDALNGVAFSDDALVVGARLDKRYVRDGEVPGWGIAVYPMGGNV